MDKFVGMKKSEFIMLITVDSTVNDSGIATVSQISNKLEMTNAAASKTIGELEDKGYLVKSVNKEDKRQSHIELTEKGKEVLLRIKRQRDDMTKAIFHKFGKENTDQLLELMEKVLDITSEEIEIRSQKENNE